MQRGFIYDRIDGKKENVFITFFLVGRGIIMATIHDENKVAIWEDDYDKVKEVAGYTSYCVDDKIYVYNEPHEGRIYNDDVPTLGNKSVCIA